MQQVKVAALAPTDPSPQDLKVAQIADMIILKATMEKNQEQNDSKNKVHKIDLYA